VASREPSARGAPDPASEWFWTGVPAGFILGVIGTVLWLLVGFWLGSLVVLAAVGFGARLALRDGQQSLVRYLVGTAVFLVPIAIVYLAFIKSLLGR
jgi:hypothetical protein